MASMFSTKIAGFKGVVNLVKFIVFSALYKLYTNENMDCCFNAV